MLLDCSICRPRLNCFGIIVLVYRLLGSCLPGGLVIAETFARTLVGGKLYRANVLACVCGPTEFPIRYAIVPQLY